MATTRMMCSLVLLLSVYFVGTQAGEFCHTRGHSYYYTEYCDYGCCGSTYDQYCCSSTVGVIVGCTIGGIVLVSVLVALICCCIKKQGHSGRVVHPTSVNPARTDVTVVYTGTSGHYAGPPAHYGMQGQGQMVQAPPYTPQGTYPPPPAYYSDPAYPPPGASGAGPGSSAPPPSGFTTSAPPQKTALP